jgi:hypothetical protein
VAVLIVALLIGQMGCSRQKCRDACSADKDYCWEDCDDVTGDWTEEDISNCERGCDRECDSCKADCELIYPMG